MQTQIENILVKETAIKKVTKHGTKPFVKEVTKNKRKTGSFKDVCFRIIRNTLVLF